jgi:hypothetical protein
MSAARNPFAWLALVLALVLGADAARTLPTQVGIDFYHLWGVPMGQRASPVALSPYTQTQEYAALLNSLAESSNDAELRRANRFKRVIVPTGTPLFYAAFSFLPDDYRAAHLLFAVLQYVAGAAAVFLLARLRDVTPWPALCVALAVELTFNPFVQDVKFGNATAFQLLFLAGCLHASLSGALARGRAHALFLPALALFVIFKPNTLWIAAMLALHYASLRGARDTIVGAALALPAAALAWGFSAWYFHDPAIWNEWLAYARGGSLVYRFEDGNQSWPALFSQLSPSRSAAEYGLLLSALVAVALAARGRAWLRDPWAAASAGVLATLATSPLVWPYYHLFALIPIAWVFRSRPRWDAASWCAVATYAALSSPVLAALLAAQLYGTLRLLMFLAWLPLVPAVASRLALRVPASPAAARATTSP